MDQILTNQTANGRSTEFGVQDNRDAFRQIAVTGPFDGATVTLEMKMPDGTWVPVAGGEWVESEVQTLQNVFGLFSLNVSGVGASTDLDAWVN